MHLIVSVKNLACNVKEMCPRKRTLYQKLRSWYFTLPICKLFPCCEKLLSRILVQFPHGLSTTMLLLIKNLDYRKNKGFDVYTRLKKIKNGGINN